MDAVSTLVSVCKVAIWITQWLDATKEKEQTLLDITTTVSRIHGILTPFQAPAIAAQLDNDLLATIRGIGEALNRTKDHLIVWREKRKGLIKAFFMPTVATNELRDDERHLTNQLIIALFSMTASNYFRGTHTLDSEMGSLVLSTVENQEVRVFWRDYVGAKIVFVPGDRFRTIFNLWFRDAFGEDLSGTVCNHLLLRIDEFGIGGVTPSSLESFTTGRSLRDRVLQLKARGDNVSRIPMPSTRHNISQIQLPLIIWVDDNRSNNDTLVSFAKRKGITVMELPSTALAKAWIQENIDFLRQNDSPSRVRIISDNTRLEADPQMGTFLNLSAGESLLRYLRGELLTMPVLIYCGASIKRTNYVLSFEMAGSTVRPTVCMNYISALADGIEDDGEWRNLNT